MRENRNVLWVVLGIVVVVGLVAGIAVSRRRL